MAAATAISAMSESEAVDLLKALVQRPTENPPGDIAQTMEWFAAALERRGHAVERHPVPDPFARHHGRNGVLNLVLRHRFGAGPTLALHAPLDTLPAGSGWANDPFEPVVKDGRLFGRGTADAKGSLVAFLSALEHVADDPPAGGTLELHVTADEETGGALGPAFLLSQGIVSPDAVISAGSAHQVVVGQQGVLHLEVILRGRQAHAARRHEGRDAIAAAVPILSALRDEPLVISTISGGRGENIVADRVRFTLDRRLEGGDDGDEVEARLIARIEDAHEHADVELECRRRLLAQPVAPTAASQELAELLCAEAEAALGHDVPTVSAPVVTAARHYAHAGIPTALYGAGPPTVAEGVDPAEDEWVLLSDLFASARAVSAVARRRLSR